MFKPLLCSKCGKILLKREGGSRAGEISRSEKSKANCRHCGTHWGLVIASDDFEWLINVVTPMRLMMFTGHFGYYRFWCPGERNG